MLSARWERFSEAAGAFGRIIHALILREAHTRFGTLRIGYLWAIVEPLIQLGTLWGYYTLTGRRVPFPASMEAFLLTGIFPFLTWRSCAIRGATAVASNRPLLTYPPVKPFTLVTARVVLELALTVVTVMFIVIGLKMVRGEPLIGWVDEPLNLIFAFAGLASLGYGFAIFSASMARVLGFWTDLIRNLSRLFYFTSGVFYTMNSLPNNARRLMLYSPIAHTIDWIRSAALPGYESNHYSPLYVFTWSFSLFFVGVLIDWLLRLSGRSEVAT